MQMSFEMLANNNLVIVEYRCDSSLSIEGNDLGRYRTYVVYRQIKRDKVCVTVKRVLKSFKTTNIILRDNRKNYQSFCRKKLWRGQIALIISIRFSRSLSHEIKVVIFHVRLQYIDHHDYNVHTYVYCIYMYIHIV